MASPFDSSLWIAVPVLFIPVITSIYIECLKWWLQYQNNTNRGRQPGVNKQRNISIQNPIIICRKKLKSYLEQRRADNSKKSPSDRAAESVATATWVIAGLTLGVVGVGVSQYIVFGRQLEVMQGQLNGMQADQRPWLKVSAHPVSLIFDQNSGEADIRYWFHIENVGHSVAVGARVEAQAIVLPASENAPKVIMQKQESFCAKTIVTQSTETSNSSNFGITLFPGEAYPRENEHIYINTLTMPEILESASDVKGHRFEFFIPYLIGCVTYRINLTEKRHQTGFIYKIGRIDRSFGPEIQIMLRIGDNLTPPALAFEPWSFGGGKID